MMKSTICLAGNPNSGKTTIFNVLAKSHEKIGNWPGTTVEVKEALCLIGSEQFRLVDLPGIYSLTAYSMDERVASEFLLQEHPDVVLCVVDASNLERNLYLTCQMLEMGQRVVVCLNKMDLAKRRGLAINSSELSQVLGASVVEAVASQNKGIAELQEALSRAQQQSPHDFHIDYGELEPLIVKVQQQLEDAHIQSGFLNRALAVKLLEEGPTSTEFVRKTPNGEAVLEKVAQAKESLAVNVKAQVLERRYAFIKGLAAECVTKTLTLEDMITVSDRIDKVLTHRFLGLPIFLGAMYALFKIVFTVGEPVVDLIQNFFAVLGAGASSGILSAGLPAWLASLVSDGIFSGVGSVAAFLPYIMILYLEISFLQDSGYLARAAFIMDRFMHALGLHGKSFIPMLLGFGCSIPGIMAARTLGSRKDRILTILVLPLMSCAARLPVYTLFTAAFFKENQGLVVFSLYVLGIVMAIVMAKLLRQVLFKGETVPLIMELPPYRMPLLKDVMTHMWVQALMFVKKAGTVIFSFVIITWALASLPFGVEYASEASIIGHIGRVVAPIFVPAGFGFWQAGVALFFGVMAKETIIGIFGTLYGAQEGTLPVILAQHFTQASGYAFLVMVALYTPCLPTLVTIRKEIGARWAYLAAGYMFVLAWLMSVLVFQIFSLFLFFFTSG